MKKFRCIGSNQNKQQSPSPDKQNSTFLSYKTVAKYTSAEDHPKKDLQQKSSFKQHYNITYTS